MRRLCLALFLTLSCAHGANGDAAAAAISAIIVAGTASAVSVAAGGCAATCAYGTFCNSNGLCEAFPCHDACGPNETCEMTPVEHCVRTEAVQARTLHIDQTPAKPAPADAPTR